jgi:hypothetical protein
MGQLKLEFVSPILGVYVNGYRILASNLEQAAADIKSWLDRYLVVIVRGQALEANQQRDLVRHFAPSP